MNRPTTHEHISHYFNTQKAFFASGVTRTLAARRKQLDAFEAAIKTYEPRLLAALHADLRKPETEAYIAEIATLYDELNYTRRHLHSWMKPQRVSSSLLTAPSKAQRISEPYGVTAVIAPWNYPIYLLLLPAIGAIAAGNTVLLKPSEYAPATSQVLAELVAHLDTPWVRLIEGGIPETQALLSLPLDYLFFTGSTAVGKIVMKAAAEHLTPITLELGGKSPAIIDRQVTMDAAIKRLVWGKYFNLGQTCVAPDYALVPREQLAQILEQIRRHIRAMYGGDPQMSPDLARMINLRHLERVQALITGDVRIGGEVDAEDLYIAPTVIVVEDSDTHPIMQEEIFGPVLPLVPYDTLSEAIAFVNARPKPLSLYAFSSNSQTQRRIVAETSSGGVCINDTIIHLSLTELPFGGVGASGMGNYHGRQSFDAFSHQKSVMQRSVLFDPAVRYPPYKTPLKLIQDVMKWLG